MRAEKFCLIWSLLALLFITLFPFWWVLRTALTSPYIRVQPYVKPPAGQPDDAEFRARPGPDRTRDLVGEGVVTSYMSTATLNFWVFLRNSFIVSGAITFGQTLFSSMAAYAFARIKFPLRDKIFFVYLTGLMIPSIVLFIPNFVFIRQLGWIGTVSGHYRAHLFDDAVRGVLHAPVFPELEQRP